jgi:7-carboxy-7-deazaguanine synthase
MKLRYSEAFYSIQGEGKFVGVPSVFLRTFGCNFRCKSFGLPKSQEVGKYNPEVEQLLKDGIDKYEKFEDLPIIHTGCDTYASIYPEFKRFMQDKDVDEVVEHLLSLTPEGKWTQDNGQDIHLILTGGEPLLGWQRFWIELFEHPRMQDLKNVTFETNATQQLRPDFAEYLSTEREFHVTFSCSPKLSVSGESWEDAIRAGIVSQYHSIPNSDLYLKFVVANLDDVEEVGRAVEQYRGAGVQCPVYLMPLGGRSEEYYLNKDRIVEIAMQKGWRYTPRLHVEVFGNAWGT